MNSNNISAESIKTELFLILDKTFKLPVNEQQRLVEEAFSNFQKKFEARMNSRDKTTFVQRVK
jgi:hypothetical protein